MICWHCAYGTTSKGEPKKCKIQCSTREIKWIKKPIVMQRIVHIKRMLERGETE